MVYNFVFQCEQEVWIKLQSENVYEAAQKYG